jgi:hypothetical protein
MSSPPFALAALTAVAGCGSGGGTLPLPNSGNLLSGGSNSSSGGGGAPGAGRGAGAVEGYLFHSAAGNGLVFGATASPPPGLVPAAGVRAEILGGGGGSSVTVGADGLLRLTGVTPGLRTLRLTPAAGSGGGGAAPPAPTDVPLTVVPGATLLLGQTPVSRAGAVDALRQFAAGQGASNAFTGSDILVTATPLPAGVRVRPALPSGDEEEMLIERPSWVIYLDLAPQARFGHTTVLALVDAETGAVRAQGALSWPLLNGASFYADSDVNATSPDAFQVAPRDQRVASASRGRFLGDEDDLYADGQRRATCRAADPDTSRTHVLMIQGDRRQDFAEDMEDVAVSLGVAPFPRTDTFRRIRTFEGSSGGRAQILQEFASVRDAAKSGDTFVLYVTSHGTINRDYNTSSLFGRGGLVFKPLPPRPPSTPEEVAATYQLIFETGTDSPDPADADGREYKAETMDIKEFDFGPCKACRIVLWIDTCFSGNWIPLLRPQLEALKDRDILILTSSSQQRTAAGILPRNVSTVDVEEGLFLLPVGGLFTDGLVEGLRRVRGSDVAETGADALAAAFPFAVAVTTAKNRDTSFKEDMEGVMGERAYQYPQMFRRPLEPDAVCGKGEGVIDVL